MSLKTQTHFNTICKVWVITPHGARQQCDSNTALTTPYAHAVHSQHASETAYHPYTHIVPSRHASDAAYHPSAHIVPSQHASDAALTLA
ncbi:hypothetical protein O181_005241 [Austropuccinia psidii MF-1]|uniref:Uncharacterized protein n=1 Tax=Austropuccinia psidii MF-1 TaxID=1389203 RepID=A0A9Q3BGX6_9BASI|nr:hypothetical protein [Austropuccinia psidii MF-1]